MPPILRAAEPSDLEPLISMWREFMDFHASHDPEFAIKAESETIRRQFLTSKLAEPDTLVLIATLEKKAVGYAIGDIRSRPPVFALTRFGHIADLYVVPNQQRSGLGSRMLQECLSWFKARGLGRVEVRTLSSNPISNSFWAKHGFIPFAQESVLQIGG